MSRADYEAFKERMREWMSDYADAYDAFEEMMNYESDEGYRLVMTTTMKLLPKFAKAAAKRTQRVAATKTLRPTVAMEPVRANNNLIYNKIK